MFPDVWAQVIEGGADFIKECMRITVMTLLCQMASGSSPSDREAKATVAWTRKHLFTLHIAMGLIQ